VSDVVQNSPRFEIIGGGKTNRASCAKRKEMQMENIIKTEIQLSEEMVAKIVASETSKALVKVPEFLENMVKQMLFHRPKKEYSYSVEKPTLYESLVQQYLRPIAEEEIKKAAEEWRPKLSVIVKKAFKTNVLDNKAFEERMLDQLAKFSSNITFYVPSKD